MRIQMGHGGTSKQTARLEGILPALEPAHAIAWTVRNAATLGEVVIVNLSGRGDKDVDTVRKLTAGDGAS